MTMKKVKILICLAICSSLLFIASCKDEPSAEDVFLSKLAKTWKPSDIGIQLDNEPVNGVFDNFTITFDKARTYKTADGNEIWNPSGKFLLKAVKNTAGFQISRDDGVEVTIMEISETALVLKLNYTSTSGGRASSVSGEYVFDLISQ